VANSKPHSYLGWIPDEASNNLAQPPASIAATGFQAGQPVPAPYFNYALHNLDRWVQYLDENVNATVLATSLNHSMRMLGGGTFFFDAQSRVLSWSEAITLAIPSSSDDTNQLPQGSVVLPSGSVAYVNVNLPFSTTADVTAGSATVINLGYEAGISVGMTVTGQGIDAGTTVTDVNGSSCTLSQPASSSSNDVTLTFAGAGSLSASVAPSATLVPGPNTVILARATDAVCSVGVGSSEMWLRDQERRTLYTAGYVNTVTAVAGQGLAALAAVYQSQGTADGRTPGNVYLADASAQQGAQRGLCLGFLHTAASAGSQAHVVRSGLLTGFANLVTGAPYYLDPAIPGGITQAKPVALGQWVAPVGVATSPTALLVHISQASAVSNALPNGAVITGDASVSGLLTAQGVTSAHGFKNFVPMGSCYTTSYAGGDLYLGQAVRNSADGSLVHLNYQLIAPYDGSITACSGTWFATFSVAFEIDIYVNGAKVWSRTYSGSQNNTFKEAFTKGTYPVRVGDIINMRCSAYPGGNTLYATAGLMFEWPA